MSHVIYLDGLPLVLLGTKQHLRVKYTSLSILKHAFYCLFTQCHEAEKQMCVISIATVPQTKLKKPVLVIVTGSTNYPAM